MKVIQHSVDTLQTALVSNCQNLVKRYRKYKMNDNFWRKGSIQDSQGHCFSLLQCILTQTGSLLIPRSLKVWRGSTEIVNERTLMQVTIPFIFKLEVSIIVPHFFWEMWCVHIYAPGQANYNKVLQ